MRGKDLVGVLEVLKEDKDVDEMHKYGNAREGSDLLEMTQSA